MRVLVFISGIISSAPDVFSPVTYIFPVIPDIFARILNIFQPVLPAIISPCIPSIFAPVHDIQAIVN